MSSSGCSRVGQKTSPTTDVVVIPSPALLPGDVLLKIDLCDNPTTYNPTTYNPTDHLQPDHLQPYNPIAISPFTVKTYIDSEVNQTEIKNF